MTGGGCIGRVNRSAWLLLRDCVSVLINHLRFATLSQGRHASQRVFGNLRGLGGGEPSAHDVDHGQMDHCL